MYRCYFIVFAIYMIRQKNQAHGFSERKRIISNRTLKIRVVKEKPVNIERLLFLTVYLRFCTGSD